MLKKLTALALAVSLGAVPTLAVAAAKSPPSPNAMHSERHNPFSNIQVGGTSTAGNTFAGTMDIIGFADGATPGSTDALAVLWGTVTDPTGKVTVVENELIRFPVQAIDPACNILSLNLGPLDLDLLGLQIHLDRVVLNITAQSGPGNLLGNLLCAVANLLNGGLLGGALTTLLNNLATILAGLGL
jgi:hypothetical protein